MSPDSLAEVPNVYSEELVEEVASIGFAFTELSLSTDSLGALRAELEARADRPKTVYRRSDVHLVGDEPWAPVVDAQTTAYVIQAGLATVGLCHGEHAATRKVGPGKVILVAGQAAIRGREASAAPTTWLKFVSRHGVVAHVLREEHDVDANLLRLTSTNRSRPRRPQSMKLSLQEQLGLASGFLSRGY